MNPIALLTAIALAALAGVTLLAARLWHRFVPVVGDDETHDVGGHGVLVLRYGGAAGSVVFAGFLLTTGLYAAAIATGTTASTGAVAGTLRAVAVGLVVIAFGTFLGTVVETLRTRRDGVR